MAWVPARPERLIELELIGRGWQTLGARSGGLSGEGLFVFAAPEGLSARRPACSTYMPWRRSSPLCSLASERRLEDGLALQRQRGLRG